MRLFLEKKEQMLFLCYLCNDVIFTFQRKYPEGNEAEGDNRHQDNDDY